MKIPNKYDNKVLIKLLKIHSDYYTSDILKLLNFKEPIVLPVINYDNRTFLCLNNKFQEIVYCNDDKIYRSINNIYCIYLVKILDLI
jgi:hypothetical protein